MKTSAHAKSQVETPAAATPAAGRLLQRKCACGRHTVAGGECHACAGKGGLLQRQPKGRRGGLPAQVTAQEVLGALGHGRDAAAFGPRSGGELSLSRVPGSTEPAESSGLRVGQPGDASEREADRVAEQVLSLAADEASAASHGATAVAPRVQRRPSAEGAREATRDEAAPVQAVLREGGAPLPPGVRDFFEPRFGQDLGGVRVHTDGRAAGTAEALGADAYTVGQHVVFGPQRFAPATPAGQKLLAHELSHVLQQTGGPTAAASSSPPVSGAGLVQRHTSFNVTSQMFGFSLGWRHPATVGLPSGVGLLVSDDGRMAVEDKGWKRAKRVWAASDLITSSNSVLTSQGSKVRLRMGMGVISGMAPDAPMGPALTLSEVVPEDAGGGPLKLEGDCGMACKQATGAPGDDEESAAVARNPRGIEQYTTSRPLRSRRTSDSGLATTEEWSEEIFKMEFGMGLSRAEALKKYDDLPAAEKERFDRKYGLNRFAAPKVGQGVGISTEYDMPGFASTPNKDTWNYHFATAVLASGVDYVSVENIANRADSDWFFWMYGPERKGQSFHEFQGGMGEHGNKFTTMVVMPGKLRKGKTKGDGVHLVADPATWETSRIALLARGTQVEALAKGENWRKVLVLSGPHAGKSGWISSRFFELR